MEPSKTYRVEIEKQAEKSLGKIPQADRNRIISKIAQLQSEPRPDGCIKLKGSLSDLYRIRSGNYRIVYGIIDDRLLILVVNIDNRKDVYRD